MSFSGNLTVYAQDFTQQPFAVREITLTPVYAFGVEGNNIIVADRKVRVTDASGVAGFSGVVSGNYTLRLIGPYKVTTVPLYVSTSGNVNAKDLISASIVTPDNQVAYSRAQADLRFYLASNPSGYVRASQTGSFVTTGQTGNFGAGAGVGANVVSLTGNQTVSGTKNFVGALQVSGQAVVTGGPYVPYLGANNVIDINRQLIQNATGISFFDDSRIEGSQLFSFTNQLSLDWSNRILTGGTWDAQGFTVQSNSVVTANQTGNFYTRDNPSGFITTTTSLNTLSPTGSTGYRVDFLNSYYRITTNSGISFTSGLNLTGVRSTAIKIDSSVSGRAVSFNANWVFLGSTVPTGIPTSKAAVLSLTSFGTGQADVVAAWGVQQ